MQTMLDSFYRVLKDKTGVDITPAPVIDQEIQYQIDSKDSIDQLSANRTTERVKKQNQRMGKPEGESGVPSLFTKAAQASSGNTLLKRI